MSKNLKIYKVFKLPETEIDTLKELEKLIEGDLDFKVHDNHVVSLNLYKKELTEIPKSFLNLEKIVSLTLSDNKIKEIPNFLKNLTYLKQLSVDRNYITELPDWILKKVKSVQFSSNSDLLYVIAEHMQDPSKDLKIQLHVSINEKLPKELIRFLKFKYFWELLKIANAIKDVLTPKEFYDYIENLENEKLKTLVKVPDDSNQINFIEAILQYMDDLRYMQPERWKIEGILQTIGKNYLDYLMDLIKDESPLRLSVLEAIIQIDSEKRDDVISELKKRDFLFNFPVNRYLYHQYFFRLLNILSFYLKPRELISYLNESHKKKLNSILGKEIRLDRKKTYDVIELIIYTILDYLDDFNYDQVIDEYENEELCDLITTFKAILMKPMIRFHLVGEGDIKRAIVKIAEFIGEEAIEMLKIEFKKDMKYVDISSYDEGHYTFSNLVDLMEKYGDPKTFINYLNSYKYFEEIFYPIWKDEYFPLLRIIEFIIEGLNSSDSELRNDTNKFLFKILEMLQNVIKTLRDYPYASYVLYFLHLVFNKTDRKALTNYIEKLTELEKNELKKGLSKLLDTTEGVISNQEEKEFGEKIIALISTSQKNNEKSLISKFTSGYLPDIEYLIKNGHVKYKNLKSFFGNLEVIWGFADFFGDSEDLKTNPPRFIKENLKIIIEKTDEKALKELFENFLPYTPPERIRIPHTWETFLIENNFLSELSTQELIELLENDKLDFLLRIIKLVESYRDEKIYFQKYIYEILIKKSSNSVKNSILRIAENDNLDSLYLIYKSGIYLSFKQEDFSSLMQNFHFLDKILLSQDSKQPVYYDDTYGSYGLDVLFSHLCEKTPSTIYAFIDYLLEKRKFDSLLVVASSSLSSLELGKIIPTLEKNKINFLIIIANKHDELRQIDNCYTSDDLIELSNRRYNLYELCLKEEFFKNFIIKNMIKVSESENMQALAVFIEGNFLDFIIDVPKEYLYRLIRNLIKAFDFLDDNTTIVGGYREFEFYKCFNYIIKAFIELIEKRFDSHIFLKKAIIDSILEDPPHGLLQFFDHLSQSILQIFEESDLLSLIKNLEFPKKVSEVINYYFETREYEIEHLKKYRHVKCDLLPNEEDAMGAIFLIFSIINDKLKEDSFNDILKQVFEHMNKTLKKKLAEQLLLVVNAGKEFDEIGMFNTLTKVLVILSQVDPNKNLII